MFIILRFHGNEPWLARPQVADGETVSNTKRSLESIVAGSRQSVIPQHGGWSRY